MWLRDARRYSELQAPQSEQTFVCLSPDACVGKAPFGPSTLGNWLLFPSLPNFHSFTWNSPIKEWPENHRHPISDPNKARAPSSLSLSFLPWPHCVGLLWGAKYTPRAMCNKSCSSEFSDVCCHGASYKHNKNHRPDNHSVDSCQEKSVGFHTNAIPRGCLRQPSDSVTRVGWEMLQQLLNWDKG